MTRKGGPLEIAPGARVDLHGLVGAAQYNGCEGLVLSGPNDKGRWEVQVDFQCDVRTIALKPENLRPKPSCGWELVALSLHPVTRERDLSEAFAQCGLLRSARLVCKEDGSSRGVCTVEMAHREGAEAALARLQGHTINGRPLRVEWSTKCKQELAATEAATAAGSAGAADRHPPQGQRQSTDEAAARRFRGAGDGGDVPARCKPEGPKEAPGDTRQDVGPGGGEAGQAEAEAEAATKRRRRSAWEAENSGGEVFVGTAGEAGGAGGDRGEGCPAEALPPESAFASMSARELRQLLTSRGVNIFDCFEKADLLEKARQLAAAPA